MLFRSAPPCVNGRKTVKLSKMNCVKSNSNAALILMSICAGPMCLVLAYSACGDTAAGVIC